MCQIEGIQGQIWDEDKSNGPQGCVHKTTFTPCPRYSWAKKTRCPVLAAGCLGCNLGNAYILCKLPPGPLVPVQDTYFKMSVAIGRQVTRQAGTLSGRQVAQQASMQADDQAGRRQGREAVGHAGRRVGRQAGTLPGGQAIEAGREGAALEHAGGGRKAGREARACRLTSSYLKVIIL